MPTDIELMEESLAATADAPELRHALFARFFEAFPERRAAFISLDASSRRMTDETLEMMLGIAKGEENWVWPLVAELSFTHRSYGRLPMNEYDGWVDMTIDVLGEAAGAVWSTETDAAWRRQGERLKAMILEASEGWDRAMPGHVAPIGESCEP